jgi:hypothetical protein
VSKWLPITEEATRMGWVENVGGRVPLKMTHAGIEGLDGLVRAFVHSLHRQLLDLNIVSYRQREK